VLFGGDPAGLDRDTLGMLAVELETTNVTVDELADGLDAADTFVRAGLARSKGGGSQERLRVSGQRTAV
jgi:tyrosyl-tRNA synthetase